MTGFLLRAVIAAFGLWLATYLIDGFRIDDSTTLLIAAVLLPNLLGLLLLVPRIRAAARMEDDLSEPDGEG